MRVIVATNNAGKLAELRELLPASIDLLSMAEAGLDSPPEDGSTFAENALIKARHAAPNADAAIADDSGLVVDALDGAPGVRSARFAGEDATDEENNVELLRRMTNASGVQRTARFVSAAAFVSRNGDEVVVEGQVQGVILERPRGTGGFGYDPLFEIQDPGAPDASGKTLAELTIAEKNDISHRGRAVRALVATLQERQLIDDSPR
ncbi:MAG: RdgB/HAM1 family non-canonical purine NTP pyrophosphatase [Thermomicrobiales bacterium]|nr:RdgB/HAM1 family non-canonical purine NTP pyrophosphatase [Thermomicrobiales bacterium]